MLLRFETRASQRWLVENPSLNFAPFDLPCKIRKEMGEMFGSKFQLLPPTGPNLGYTVWVKKVAPFQFFAVFSLLVNLCKWKLPWLFPNIFLCLHQFWSIIWIFVWNVSFLPVRPLKFYEFNSVCYEIHEFFI